MNKGNKNQKTPVLSVQDLSVSVRNQQQTPILKSISFELYPGEFYALVGESGSGKSMTSLAMMRLLPNALEIKSGLVTLDGQNLLSPSTLYKRLEPKLRKR